MIRKPIVQSLAFSSVLALAAASGVAWAADSSQQQSMSDSAPSGQMTQQDANSSATTSSGMSSGSQTDQSADASSGTATGPATGDDSRTPTTSSTATEAASDSEQTATVSGQQQGAEVEPVLNEQELAELRGKTVVNMQGEEIGKVDSIVRDRTDQSLKAVIKSGGFFGIGGDKVAVPAEDLQLQGDKVQLNTPMTKEELQQTASAYDAENYEPIDSGQQAAGGQAGQQPPGGAMESPRG